QRKRVVGRWPRIAAPVETFGATTTRTYSGNRAAAPPPRRAPAWRGVCTTGGATTASTLRRSAPHPEVGDDGPAHAPDWSPRDPRGSDPGSRAAHAQGPRVRAPRARRRAARARPSP